MACLAAPHQLPLYEELWNLEGSIKIPGGSCLNTIRSANFMLRETLPNKCTFFGCIGNDDEGKVLERELEATGIHGNFHKDEETPTASCAVIVIN